MERILITGASGQLGKLVIHQLLNKIPASQLVLMARDKSKMNEFTEKGIEIRTGDYHHPETLLEAFEGISKVLLISSNDFNNRLGQHKNVVDAAKNAGVKHLLYTGVSMNNIESSPIQPLLGDHFETEAYIQQLGMQYTFLQNTLYAEIIPMFLGEHVLETGVIFPSAEGRIAFALRSELAECIAKIILGNEYINQTIQLSPSHSYSFADIAQYLSELSGKQILFMSPDASLYEDKLKEMNLPAHLVQMITLFAAAMKNNDFQVCTPNMKQLLGREEADLKSFLKEVYHL